MNIDHPSQAQIPQLRGLWQEAFGDGDRFLDAFFDTAFDPQRCLVAQNAAAACYWLSCTCRGKKIAYLYAVATAKESRGQGLCRGLMEKAKQVIASQGYAGILLVPGSDALRGMYRKMGFSQATSIREFSGPSGEPAPIKQLTSQAYALQRISYLPEGSAIEGEEMLTFFATQAKFYRCGDAICAAIREGNSLFIPELLGDETQAAAIAASLGYGYFTARTPGCGSPWAMYCPLTAAEAPTHFSLALD